MGQPARQPRASQPRSAAVRLRLVEPTKRRALPAASTRARAKVQEDRARSLFTAFASVLILVVALGGARVTLITRATEVSISEKQLQAEIKEQRVEADKLEIDRSVLSTPSRIAGIASSEMHMSQPRSVKYMSMSEVMDGTEELGGAKDRESARRVAGGITGVLGAVMELSAGEAQSLLVGDLGLAGSR